MNPENTARGTWCRPRSVERTLGVAHVYPLRLSRLRLAGTQADETPRCLQSEEGQSGPPEGPLVRTNNLLAAPPTKEDTLEPS